MPVKYAEKISAYFRGIKPQNLSVCLYRKQMEKIHETERFEAG